VLAGAHLLLVLGFAVVLYAVICRATSTHWQFQGDADARVMFR
jgi:hypothetical protein